MSTDSLLTRLAQRGAIVLLALVSLPLVLAAQSTGTVTGRVTSGGEGIAGAVVSAVGTARNVQTRTDGTYRLTLPPGRYEVRARALSYAAGRDSVTVTVGGTHTVNFALERSIATLEAVSTLG